MSENKDDKVPKQDQGPKCSAETMWQVIHGKACVHVISFVPQST